MGIKRETGKDSLVLEIVKACLCLHRILNQVGYWLDLGKDDDR
jgi:hypothetical protein